PARVCDAVHVHDDRNRTTSRESEQGPEIARRHRRAERENGDAGRVVRDPRRESLELRRPARDRLARARDAVVPVEDAQPTTPPGREEPEPAPAGPRTPT